MMFTSHKGIHHCILPIQTFNIDIQQSFIIASVKKLINMPGLIFSGHAITEVNGMRSLCNSITG